MSSASGHMSCPRMRRSAISGSGRGCEFDGATKRGFDAGQGLISGADLMLTGTDLKKPRVIYPFAHLRHTGYPPSARAFDNVPDAHIHRPSRWP